MSPTGGREETRDVENSAIVERLDSLHREFSSRLDAIAAVIQRIEEQRLNNIEVHLRTLNGRVGECEKWQAGADPMVESINERIGENSDCLEKFRKEQSDQRDWINQQKGWSSGRTQMIVQISGLIGIAATLITLLLKFHP